MKPLSLASMLCLFIVSCTDQPESATNQNKDSTPTAKAAESNKTNNQFSNASIAFPYLTVKANALRDLINVPHFKRIVFNVYPHQSGQSTMMRLAGTMLKANRDTIGNPLFTLFDIQPNTGGNYPPLPLPSGIYFAQYDLTDLQIQNILTKVSGNPDIILKPIQLGSFTVQYELSCTSCFTTLGILPPCPPYRPE